MHPVAAVQSQWHVLSEIQYLLAGKKIRGICIQYRLPVCAQHVHDTVICVHMNMVPCGDYICTCKAMVEQVYPGKF